MRTEIYNYIVPNWAICALEYGDLSGLNDDEVIALDNFSAELNKIPCKHYHISWSDDEPYFSHHNDIDNLGNSVQNMQLVCYID